MKKYVIAVMFAGICFTGFGQTAGDLFRESNVKISWLGIDFSHVKLIGDFSEFAGAGEKSTAQVRDKYFGSWNHLILAEPDKYDLRGMLRKGEIVYDIDMIMELNSRTPLENMEANNNPFYKLEDIEGFVSEYNFEGKEGIGIMFIAESLNKFANEAYFHFVAIDLESKEILVHERLRGVPRGFGLRNFWAGAVYSIIKDIRSKYYKIWKNRYLN